MKRKKFRYPFEPGTTRPWDPGPFHRVELACQYRFREKQSPRPNSVQLAMVNGRQRCPLSKHDMPLIFLAHDDRHYLPAFFEHYRSMGVTRFICVDDRSIDGTREYLLAQRDVDVFQSDVRYREAARGKIWREKLFHLYGYDRWYLNVDSDEFLIFEGLEKEPIKEFANRLLEKRIRRLPAPMIDLYPITRLSDAIFDGRDRTMPWEVATHFDGTGYVVILVSKGIQVFGGVRHRMLGGSGELMKYPLVYWDRHCSMGKSIHRPLPGVFNFASVTGCLLHFKIFSDIRENARRAVEAGQYYNGAEYYDKIQRHLDAHTDIRFQYDRSIAYRGPEDLIERGFMLPLTS